MISARLVPIEIYTVSSQLTILLFFFQWRGTMFYALITENAPIMRMVHTFDQFNWRYTSKS